MFVFVCPCQCCGKAKDTLGCIVGYLSTVRPPVWPSMPSTSPCPPHASHASAPRRLSLNYQANIPRTHHPTRAREHTAPHTLRVLRTVYSSEVLDPRITLRFPLTPFPPPAPAPPTAHRPALSAPPPHCPVAAFVRRCLCCPLFPMYVCTCVFFQPSCCSRPIPCTPHTHHVHTACAHCMCIAHAHPPAAVLSAPLPPPRPPPRTPLFDCMQCARNRAQCSHSRHPRSTPPPSRRLTCPLQSPKPRVQAVRTERALIAHTMRMLCPHRTRPVP